jgi:hypothetical protein
MSISSVNGNPHGDCPVGDPKMENFICQFHQIESDVQGEQTYWVADY